MKSAQWQQLDSLFHSALERVPEERRAFLDQACAGDDALRQRVEALLAAHAEAGSFIESPALEVEARGLAADQRSAETAMATGETISHYRIISSLGSGGMGEVYLAQDTVLSRQVALKLLPEYFASDRDRFRRFQQEARAASALNHPNIITIFEIGEFTGRHFIVTEFIDGTTLRQHFFGEDRRASGKPLQLREVLDIAIQTADALAAAHEAHIAHRDIKPENIMLRRRDGYVKVLDFGLAKLTEGPTAEVDTEAPTKTQVRTSAGLVMGTVTYMSPEQARGEKVDIRTDIWSLGVVLYEMLAGSAPFERSTPSEVIALILEREPPPLARYSREVPPELERIVSKALTKDKEERYQTAKDLLVDLRRLRQQLEVKAEVERLATPGAGSEVAVPTGGTQAAFATTDEATATTQAEIGRRTSSAEFLLSEVKRHKQGAVIALALILLGGIGFGFYKFVIHPRPKPAPFQAKKFAKLITTGNASMPSVSPDGKHVVYVVNAAGQQSLWINQVATTSNAQIIPPAEVQYGRPNFSHDSNYVYYVVTEKGDPHGALYRIPALGNATPRKLLVNIQSVISLSPDDKRFAFYRSNPGEGEEVLMVANADGSGEQKLTSRKGDEWFENGVGAAQGPAWSPDGKVIACGAGKGSLGRQPATVIVVHVEDGAQKEFTSQRWSAIGNLAWLGDGSGLMFGAEGQIWHLTYPGGEVRQITSGDFRQNGLTSMTADSSTILGQQTESPDNIWVAPGGDASRARQITSSNESEGGFGLSWTSDGKIVYSSTASGNVNVWVMNADGSNKKQLTFDSSKDVSPIMTPDGRYIVFVSSRAGKWSNVWRMDADGSHPKQLTNGIEDFGPHCSPDSRWVVYVSVVDGKTALWKVSIDGGNPAQLTNKDSNSPVVSPDGKWIACRYWNEQSDSPKQIAVIPFEGGEPIKLFEGPKSGSGGKRVRWTPDGRAITYVNTSGGVSNIWSQSIDGGPAKRLTDFKDQLIFAHDWSHDGKQLACARGVVVTTIVLISDSSNQQ